MTDPTNPPWPKIADPRSVVISLHVTQNAPPLAITVWPDWRGAPDPSSQVLSVLALGLLGAQQQVAALSARLGALEILVAEAARGTSVGIVGRHPAPFDRARDQTRHDVALAAVTAAADSLTIAPPEPEPSAPASAFDGLTI